MPPTTPLPFTGTFASAEEYTEELLKFITETETFQILCGGIHILDFFTVQPGLFHHAVPQDWHPFVLECDIMLFLDLLVREDLDSFTYDGEHQPPESLIKYIRSIRDLSLSRKFRPVTDDLPKLPRTVARGMNPKKIHEVRNFAGYVTQLSKHMADDTGADVSHFVDFGSGQNYLGRALASEPYNRHVVAVEGREHNVAAAKLLDVSSGLAVKPQVMRNKKLWSKVVEKAGPGYKTNPEQLAKAIQEVAGVDAFDFRSNTDLGAVYEKDVDKGSVQYISGRLDSGDLSEVIANIDVANVPDSEKKRLKLMAVSIHSCGNLSHYAIRSLIMNEDIQAIAIVGCCYNLLTEKLGPPTYKHPYLRPTLQAVNGRLERESSKHDPQGFPMSKRFSSYNGEGIRLNITARMMACQAVQNWTREESDGFFTRHLYRAVLQKIFLDRGVVTKIKHSDVISPKEEGEIPKDTQKAAQENVFDVSTSPVIIGSISKSRYSSFKTYVRAAVAKLCTNSDYKHHADLMHDKMGGLTDEEIEQYEKLYMPRSKEVSVTWSLMAFSAIVVESLIVSDRWTFLTEQNEVEQAWVEPIFDFKESPRNLVVVGLKK